jgi:mannose-6-phosphate isomerase-like protein (cupin superfamily)
MRVSLILMLVTPPFVAAQNPSAPGGSATQDTARSGFFAVPSGASRTSGKVNVKVSGKDTGGAFAIVETPTAVGYGPPLHRHHIENEWFYALDGEYDVQVSDSVYHIKRGGSVYGPRMVPHTWRNVGKTPGRLMVVAQPAGHLEAFLEDLANLGPPDKRDPAAYRAVYAKHQMDIVGPPLAEKP